MQQLEKNAPDAIASKGRKSTAMRSLSETYR